MQRYFSGSTDHLYEDAAVQYAITPIAMEYAFNNSSIVYSCSHGVDNSLTLDKDIVGRQQTFLSALDIDTGKADQAELIYISACLAGIEFVPKLTSGGRAAHAIGFSKSIKTEASSYFDKRFFYYYFLGYSIESCVENAVRDLDDVGYYVADDGREYLNGEPYFCGINEDTVVVCSSP